MGKRVGEDFRERIEAYIRANARPAHKFSHQARLYDLTREIGAGLAYDDDVVFAAAWLHDLGVFVGHRPEEPEKLGRWDHVAYVAGVAPGLLRSFEFPEEKINFVMDAVRTHQPQDDPQTLEGKILRDADILEQLGSVGILRTAAKVGVDTRFPSFEDARRSLQRALDELPEKIRTDRARKLALPRMEVLRSFLADLDGEELG